MTNRILQPLLLLSACNTYDPSTALDHIERGTTWQLAVGSGMGQLGAADSDCRSFVSKIRHVPDDSGDCDVGCSCSLQFSLAGSGDQKWVELELYEWCTDAGRWELTCSRDNADTNQTALCEGRPSGVLWSCSYAARYQQLP